MNTEKVKINPALLAALEHYAEGRFNPNQPSCFVYVGANGGKHPWSIERTCGVAAEVLGNEESTYLKLKTLQEGLRKFGYEAMYLHIMGEKLP